MRWLEVHLLLKRLESRRINSDTHRPWLDTRNDPVPFPITRRRLRRAVLRIDYSDLCADNDGSRWVDYNAADLARRQLAEVEVARHPGVLILLVVFIHAAYQNVLRSRRKQAGR